MSRAFDITPSTTTAASKPGGVTEFPFTVSNKVGKALRARASAEPDDPATRGWLSVAEAERDFTYDGTYTFTVRVAIPPGAAPGAYAFHLLVSSTSNPDEDYAHGPSITVTVAAAPMPTPPFPWWLVAVGAGVVLLALGGWGIYAFVNSSGIGASCHPDKPECKPDLVCVAADPKKAELGTCRAKPLAKCHSADDCTTRLCEKGLCAYPPPGASCSAPGATCPANQVCVTGDLGAKTCLLNSNQPCTSHVLCASGWCREDKSACSATDRSCQTNTDCPFPSVTGYFCQSGACVLPNGRACTANGECQSGFCNVAGSRVCEAVVIPVGPSPPKRFHGEMLRFNLSPELSHSSK